MRGIFKIIIAMALISLAAYGLHLLAGPDAKPPSSTASSALVPPRVAVQQAANGADANGAAADRLIYPVPAALRAMHLSYSVFDVHEDGDMMALPLPPGSAWQTMVALDPAGHQRLVLTPMSPDCGFPVVIAMYRADQAATLWHGELPAHSGSAKQVVDLSAIGAKNPLMVSLKMADGAKNNFSCNVTVGWDDSQPAKS